MHHFTPEQVRAFALLYIERAVGIAKASFTRGRRVPTARWRDAFAKRFFGYPSFESLKRAVDDHERIRFVYRNRDQGPYTRLTERGCCQSFFETVEALKPYCKDADVQQKLIDVLDTVGAKTLRNRLVRLAGYRIMPDMIDQLYVLVYDQPPGELNQDQYQYTASINLVIKENLIIDVLELPFE